MSLLITDSGLGGLSMLAHLVLELESKMIGEAGSEMKMVYLNAVPRDHYGYNDMTSAEEEVIYLEISAIEEIFRSSIKSL